MKDSDKIKIIEGASRRATKEELDYLIPFAKKFDKAFNENIRKRYADLMNKKKK
jgi:hypothetical protein